MPLHAPGLAGDQHLPDHRRRHQHRQHEVARARARHEQQHQRRSRPGSPRCPGPAAITTSPTTTPVISSGGRKPIEKALHPLGVARQQHRQVQHQRELGQLRRLERQRPQPEPAHGPVDPRPDHQHRRQQRDGHEQQRVAPAPVDASSRCAGRRRTPPGPVDGVTAPRACRK